IESRKRSRSHRIAAELEVRPSITIFGRRHSEYFRKCVQSVHSARDDHEKDYRFDERQCDVAQFIPPARSIYIGGLVDRFGNILNSGQKQHHPETRALEHHYKRDRGKRSPWISKQPCSGKICDVKFIQDHVYKSVIWAEYQHPDRADNIEVENIRKIECASEKTARAQLVVE